MDLACAMLTRRIAGEDSTKYFAVVDIMFRQQDRLVEKTSDTLRLIGRQAGLSTQAVEDCLKDQAMQDQISRPEICRGRPEGRGHPNLLHQWRRNRRRSRLRGIRKANQDAVEKLIRRIGCSRSDNSSKRLDKTSIKPLGKARRARCPRAPASPLSPTIRAAKEPSKRGSSTH